MIYDLVTTFSWALTMNQVLCLVLYMPHCVESSKEICEMEFLIPILNITKLKFRAAYCTMQFFIGTLVRNY